MFSGSCYSLFWKGGGGREGRGVERGKGGRGREGGEGGGEREGREGEGGKRGERKVRRESNQGLL